MQCGRILARSLSTSTNAMGPIKTVTVVGGGAMGAGIAQIGAAAGNKINLVDLSEDVLKKSQTTIQTGLSRVGKKMFDKDQQKIQDYVSNTLKNITFTSDLGTAAKGSDLVVEAIVENLEAKQKLFQSIDNVAPAHTIFASNTSSIKIANICKNLARKDRFGGLHFFNPVPVMKLVEVVSTGETSPETHKALADWGKSVGKVTVDCKDTPGFIVNQLLVPYLVEAIRMVERGDASPKDVDTAMKLGAGHPMGPLELADYVGLDVIYFILKGWSEEFPDEKKYKVPSTLEKLIEQKRFGIKAGAGFYDYPKKA